MEKKIRTELMKMSAMMLVLAALGIYAHDFVIAGIQAKVALNLTIFATFGIAAWLAFRHVFALNNEVLALKALQIDYGARNRRPLDPYKQPAVIFHEPELLGHGYRMITEEFSKQDSLQISNATAQMLLHDVDLRISDRKSTIMYFSGLMVFLGLLGAFMGLMKTVHSVGDLIGGMDVSGTGGTQVPLSNVAKFERTIAPLVINHQGQFPAVTISFGLREGVTLDVASESIRQAILDMRLPDVIQAEFAGDAKAFASSAGAQPLLILAALVAVYLVLGVLYESLAHPLTIISTLPSAGLGALLALQIFRAELTVIAFIGIILLIGLVKKNGIMMVDFALAAERQEGLSPAQAIREACLARFRPIMMTTLAAMLGAIPLIVATGPGSELRRPLGMTIVGGLIVSQVLTLYTTPVIYLLLDRLHRRLWGKGAPVVVPAE